MTTDIDEIVTKIEAAANEATPGEWLALDRMIYVAGFPYSVICENAYDNTSFIVAVQPNNIAALIADWRRKTEALESVNRILSPGNRTFDEMIRDYGYAVDRARAALGERK